MKPWPSSRDWLDEQLILAPVPKPRMVEAKRGRPGGARGWLYWLKRYRTGPGLDELNNIEPLKIQLDWWRGSPCPNDDYVR